MELDGGRLPSTVVAVQMSSVSVASDNARKVAGFLGPPKRPTDAGDNAISVMHLKRSMKEAQNFTGFAVAPSGPREKSTTSLFNSARMSATSFPVNCSRRTK